VDLVAPSDPVSEALRAFGPDPNAQVCVVEAGELVGTLSQLEVLRALKLRELRESQRRTHGWGVPVGGGSRA
jgi:hypothetical protein